MELFLPGQVVSAENQGTFSDYHFVHPSTDYFQAIIHMLAGDMWTGYYEFEQAGNISAPGIFFDQIFSCDGITEVCSRLSKN